MSFRRHGFDRSSCHCTLEKSVVLCLFRHSLDTVVVGKMDFDKFDFALFIKDETAAPEELKVRKVLYQGICNTEE